MKAITIRQPWASLIMLGAKRIETRSWRVNYRGRIAIHAGTVFRAAEKHFARTAVPYAHLVGKELPLGVVLGTAVLADVLPVSQLGALIDTSTIAGTRERMLGDYSPGRFGWVLKDVLVFAEPIPAKGSLSLWEWGGWDRATYLQPPAAL